jgi:hypothetical protein
LNTLSLASAALVKSRDLRLCPTNCAGFSPMRAALAQTIRVMA